MLRHVQRPCVNFYAPNFILYEVSSPFLNFHWCCDKLNLTGSPVQLINGVILLVTFFCFRIVWGPWQAFNVTKDAIVAYFHVQAGKPILGVSGDLSANATLTDMSFANGPSAVIPWWLIAVYATSNVVLNLLNFYWFTKMITAIRKRFTGEKRGKQEEGGVLMEEMESDEMEAEKEKTTTSTVDGVQVLEVEKMEVRKRNAKH